MEEAQTTITSGATNTVTININCESNLDEELQKAQKLLETLQCVERLKEESSPCDKHHNLLNLLGKWGIRNTCITNFEIKAGACILPEVKVEYALSRGPD